MKVLVLGGSGQLGQALRQELLRVGHQVIATYNTKPFEGGVRLDVTDFTALEDLIIKSRPEVVVNASAFTDVDGCEANRAPCLRVNAEAVRHMARAARVVGSYLVQVSTDYVFDGEKGGYREEDEPNPVNYYGLSKLLGEAYALSYDLSLVVRTSGVYSGYKGNFPRFVAERLSRGQQVNAIADSYYSPIHAAQLARAIVELIPQRRTGVLHVAGARVDRYSLALMIAREAGLPQELVKPASFNDMSWRARRPRDSSLDISRARAYVGFDFSSLEDGVRLLVGELRVLGVVQGNRGVA